MRQLHRVVEVGARETFMRFGNCLADLYAEVKRVSYRHTNQTAD